MVDIAMIQSICSILDYLLAENN